MCNTPQDLNVEYEVLKWATEKLCTGFRCASKSLCASFYAKDLIPTQVRRTCNDNSVDNDSCVQLMVSTLQDRVQNDPKAYNTILKVVKNETGLSYLGRILENKKETMLAEIKKEKERLETEKKEREHEKMEAQKKEMEYQKMMESEHRNTQLHETIGMGNVYFSGSTHRSSIVPTSETAASDFLSYNAEARNALPQLHQRGRSESAEYVHMLPSMIPFGGQCSTAGGDIFSLPASPLVRLKKQTTGLEFQTEFKKREHFTGSIQSSRSISDQQTASLTNHIMKKSCGKEVIQPNMINRSATLEHVGKHETKTEREAGERQQMKEEEEEEEEKQGEEWVKESSTEGDPSDSEALVVGQNNFQIFLQSLSNTSLNSDSTEYKTPPESRRNSVNSLTSLEETTNITCANCQITARKLYEKEQENEGLQDEIDMQCHKKQLMESAMKYQLQNLSEQIRDLNFKLKKQEHENEILMLEKSKQRAEKEKERAEKEKERAEKEKERAEKERERAEKEKERSEKEKERMEKERERGEKETERERRLFLEKELIELREELKRRRPLQCEEQRVFAEQSEVGFIPHREWN